MNLFTVEAAHTPAQLKALKEQVAAEFGLPEEAAVMITELRCSEPGCPPLETVIAILQAHQSTRKLTVHKPIHEITYEDICSLSRQQ